MNKYIDLNKPFAFHCKTHGLVFVKARDHIGENEERVAYGCYRCGDKKELEELQMSKSLEEYVEHRVQTADLAELKEFMREQLLDWYNDWGEDELAEIGIIKKKEKN